MVNPFCIDHARVPNGFFGLGLEEEGVSGVGNFLHNHVVQLPTHNPMPSSFYAR